MNTLLFDENLGSASNSAELAILKRKYSHYDPIYVAVSTMISRPEFRAHLESIWEQYEPYADSNFLVDFRKQFNQRSWEMYLGVTLLNRKYILDKHTDIGPDFKIKNNENNVYIEAVAVEKGSGMDKAPDIEYGKVLDVPEREMLLRLTSGINQKHKQYLSYIEKKIISNTDSYIIAINRSALEHFDPQIPLILKCLFGIGYQTLQITKNKQVKKSLVSNWTSRMKVDKTNGSSVDMSLFQAPEFAGISAIIYCENNILNSPKSLAAMGDDLVIAHNPLAKNPLPANFFKFGSIWKLDGNQLQCKNY